MIKEVITVVRQMIVVYLRDTEYARRLTRYLNEQLNYRYQIILFSEEDSYKRYLNEKEPNIIITRESYDIDYSEYVFIERVIYLVEHLDFSTQNIQSVNETYVNFYQYQSMEFLLELLSINHKESNQLQESVSVTTKKVKQIGIYQPYYTCHSTSIVNLLYKHIQKGQRWILISFLPYDSSIQIQDKRNENNPALGVSDVIYYMKETTDSVMNILDKVIVREGSMDYINPVNHCLDLLDLQTNEMRTLRQALENRQYSTIFVVFSMITPSMIEWIGTCDRIVGIYNAQLPDSCRIQAKKQLELIAPTITGNKYYEWILNTMDSHAMITKEEVKHILGDAI